MASGSDYNPMKQLECPICQEAFKTPKMLPCGHTICLDPCLRRLASGMWQVRCPECRADHSVPSGDVSNYPTNFLILRLLEGEKQHQTATIEPSSSRCPSCRNRTFLFKCLHCKKDICEKCRTKHSKEMLDKTLALVTDLQKSSESNIQAEPSDEPPKKLKEYTDKCHQSIDTVVDTIIDSLQLRRKELKDQVSTFAKDEEPKLVERHALFQSNLKETLTFCENSNKRLVGDGEVLNQTDLFEMQSQCKRYNKDNEFFKNDAATPTEVTMDLDDHILRGMIANFGVLNEKPRKQKPEPPQPTPSQDARPKQQRKPHTFANEAEVLLYGLRRKGPKGRKQ